MGKSKWDPFFLSRVWREVGSSKLKLGRRKRALVISKRKQKSYKGCMCEVKLLFISFPSHTSFSVFPQAGTASN